MRTTTRVSIGLLMNARRSPLLLCSAAVALPVPAAAQVDLQAALHDTQVVLARMTGADRPQVSGIAAQRTAAIIAENRALSPENAVPTVFHAPVSLDDADVLAKARGLSDQAGHNGLYYDYFRFRVAIDKLRQTKGDKLDIPRATYRLYPPAQLPGYQGVIELTNLSHVVIDGRGSTLLFYYIGNSAAPLANVHPRSGIRLAHSDHIAVRDLVMDWAEPLAVPVTIHGTGRDGVPQKLAVDPAFPIDSGSPMGITIFLPFDTKGHHFLLSRDRDPADLATWQAENAPGGSMPYTCSASNAGSAASACFRYRGGQTYTFAAGERLAPVPVKNGNFLATVRNNNFAAILGDWATSYVILSGITIYSSPGAGIQFIASGPALRITHCRIVRKPDEMLAPGEQRRFLSTNADGINFITTAGDLVLEDSEIADQGDDGLNVNAQLRKGTAIGPMALQTPNIGSPSIYAVGGLIDVMDEKARNYIAQNATIDAVAMSTSEAPQSVSITLGHLDGALIPGRSYLLSVRAFDSSRVLIRNNWFHDNSERGVVVHGRDVAVVGNRFDRNAESAISAYHDNVSGTPEGEPVQNLIIAGNTIHDANVQWFDFASRPFAPPAAIDIHFATRAGFGVANPIVDGSVMPKKIIISQNVVDSGSGTGILVSQAQDVIVEENRVSGVNTHKFAVGAIDLKPVVMEDVRTTQGAVKR